jgi:hypothetical protein
MGDADLRLYAYKQFKYPVTNVLSEFSVQNSLKQGCLLPLFQIFFKMCH